MDSLIPQELNWVKARAECTLEAMFKKLRDEIIQDIAIRNGYLNDHERAEGISYSLKDTDPKTFSVERDTQSGIPTFPITFGIIGASIKAMDGRGNIIMEVSIGLNDSGRCALRAGSREIEMWQFRKKTLEGFFFAM